MGKSLIQPPIKINFYYGRYLSSGCVMDGPAFTPWQDDGLWMPAAPCWGRSRAQQRWHQSNYCPSHHGNAERKAVWRWWQRGGVFGGGASSTHPHPSFPSTPFCWWVWWRLYGDGWMVTVRTAPLLWDCQRGNFCVFSSVVMTSRLINLWSEELNGNYVDFVFVSHS